MKIAHLYPFLGRDKGGIAACLPPQLNALAAQNVACRLISQRFAGDSDLEALDLGATDFEITRAPTRDASGFGFAPALRAIVQGSHASVVHSHGLWMWSDCVASQVARAHNKPHIVSPHGMLEPWPMANSARKKQIMWRLFQQRAPYVTPKKRDARSELRPVARLIDRFNEPRTRCESFAWIRPVRRF